jgi:hypothetical protein
MPAFVAHFLIARAVFSKTLLPEETRRYFLLGSVGPDLPYYRNVLGSAIGEFFEDRYNPDSPGLYAGYGDYFHARTPNVFPMKMLETIRKDKDATTRDRKLAYALGYLTHVAADQHIHPFVEEYAGPYYVTGANRKRHRTIEVYEDILLYGKIVNSDFSGEDFRSWFDVSEERKEDVQGTGPEGQPQLETVVTRVATPAWFRSFIQRSFLESYSLIIDDGEIDKWVNGFGSIFRFLGSVGPYHDALKNLEDDGSLEAREMKDRFGDKSDYMKTCFEPAKAVASRYIAAGIDFFGEGSISEGERNRFLSLVSDADLTGPLVDI